MLCIFLFSKLFFLLNIQVDEERAQIEEVLQRGEQILHQPMEDNKKEKIRLQLLLLRARYNKTKVLSRERLCFP